MTRFRTWSHEQTLLLPPDLRDWVPENHLVNFVIEAVDGLDISVFRVNERGTGNEQYHPAMMLCLLIYCYACGIFSSRRIERATWENVCVRYLTADTHPDHDTICKFRRENESAITKAFVHVLMLAREMEVFQVGTISIDGTKIDANASKSKNVRYDRAGELEKRLEEDIQELLEKADEADDSDDDEGGGLPEEISRREKLREKMRKARAELEKRARERAQKQQADYRRKVAARNARKGSAKGCHIKPPKDVPEDKDQCNLTDPDSRLMRKSKRSGYQQAYNAQAVVDAGGSQLILAAYVSQCPSDRNELSKGCQSVSEEIGAVRCVLADNGYANGNEVSAVEKSGIDVLVSVHAEEKQNSRRYDFRPERVIKSKESKDTVHGKTWVKEMALKLEREENRELYRLRKQTVEPVFGIIKHVMGFRQFLLRGLKNVENEWNLVALSYNMKRLYGLKAG
jgi:transposase